MKQTENEKRLYILFIHIKNRISIKNLLTSPREIELISSKKYVSIDHERCLSERKKNKIKRKRRKEEKYRAMMHPGIEMTAPNEMNS